MESKSRVFGIVSEFNPFHLGHEALLSACRAKGASRIICVMSGNFVQRGEAAVFSKWARAKAAVACGADLVLELPTSFAAAGAERFALGAVSILKDAGADTLAFGVESAEASELQTIAGYLRSDDFSGRLKAKLSQGVSFPAAREASVRDALGVRPAEILRDPNHILAIEYLKAAQTLDFHPALFPVRRVGAAHDSEVISGYAAKPIREALLRGEFPGETFPAAARDIFLEEIRKNRAPASLRTCERAILSYLRTEGAEAFHGISDLSEGIENAIVKSARTACTLDDLCRGAKSKRYSHARIRRLILAAFLRLRQNPALPLYLKPLAANDAGLSLLGKIESDASLPVITKYSEHRNLSCEALALYQEECRLSDQYALMLPVPASCGAEQRNSLFILR